MLLKRCVPLALAASLAAAIPTSATAQDVAGRWILAVELDAGSGDATFDFQVNGNEITGTYTGTLGENPVTGTIDGASVSFGFTVDQVGEVTYEGTIEGDTMRGTTEYGLLGSGTFTGRRASG
jgi:hypothetical protein